MRWSYNLKVDVCVLKKKVSFKEFLFFILKLVLRFLFNGFLIFLLRKLRAKVEMDHWIQRQSDELLNTGEN